MIREVPTIDNILKFDFDTVIPDHGPVATRADLERFKQRMQTLQTRMRELIAQGVPKEQYLSKLKTDDLGWSLDPTTLFVRNAHGSHNPDESMRLDDLALATRVLAGVLGARAGVSHSTATLNSCQSV